jgi:hypothetical protein
LFWENPIANVSPWAAVTLPPVVTLCAAVNWVVDVVTATERLVAAFAFHNVYVIVSALGEAEVGTAVAEIRSKVQAAGMTI